MAQKQKNIILTGGSGMVGNLILHRCLASEEVQKVTSIVRKPSNIIHPKLYEIVHTNFLDYSTLREQFKNQDVVFYCIGVYTGTVPREKFREITVGYTEAFAATLKEQSSKTVFCFLSGQGSDMTEKSAMMFAKDKGRAENILMQLQFERFHTFRPGYIYPSTPRTEPNVFYKIFKMFYKPVSLIYPNIGITSDDLSFAMVKVALSGSDKMILENKDIRNIAGLR